MPSLAAAKAANAATKLPYIPVALFVGGTSGIGRSSVEAFARYTKGDAHIIVSGRNEAAAKEIIDTLPRTSNSTYEFLACDATLMSNVSAACGTLTSPSSNLPNRPLKKLNYLFLSPGFLSFDGRNETSEGIDRKLAVHFYARFKFAVELMPLLQAAHDAGEDARVVSVLGAGNGGPVDLKDLGLKKTYSIRNSAYASPTYTSLVAEELAKRHEGISFIHINPGGVNTSLADFHWTTRLLSKSGLFRALLTSPQDCAEWMLRPLFDSAFAKGAFHLDNHAEPYPSNKLYITPEAQKAVYQHFLDTVSKY